MDPSTLIRLYQYSASSTFFWPSFPEQHSVTAADNRIGAIAATVVKLEVYKVWEDFVGSTQILFHLNTRD